uniref:Uncharacterized protein n=1 Tax=Picea glauca TaxID=3330 RepID=A0A101M321_PICGL|nr:hypothetical protein ABT39_MTgene3205 [Picea glauca]
MKPSFFGLNRDGAIRMTTCEVPWNWGAWHQHSNKLFNYLRELTPLLGHLTLGFGL